MKIVVLGYGIEGKSARRFLKKKYPKATIEIRDAKISQSYLSGLETFDMLVRSPGIKYLLPEIQHAQKKGVKVTSATKLFFANAKCVTIGITGTKGKGTTTTILYQILKQASKNVYLVGNIGTPMLDIVPKLKKQSIAIVELSSFQLQDMDTAPHIAVVLEIVPDHLNYHKSMKEYVMAKSKIVSHQTKNDICVYVKNNSFARTIAQKGKGQKIPVDILRYGKEWQNDVIIPGVHNVYNSAVAAAVASALGISNYTIRKGLRSFRGLQYHLELVRTYKGVTYYNDSASTNPVSTVAALATAKVPKILIAGGADKNLDYSALKASLRKNTVKNIVLYGANKKKIAQQIGAGVLIVFAKDLQSALFIAISKANKGDAIIFSPASASFDMFKNSKERGHLFTNLVRALH